LQSQPSSLVYCSLGHPLLSIAGPLSSSLLFQDHCQYSWVQDWRQGWWYSRSSEPCQCQCIVQAFRATSKSHQGFLSADWE